ncbi:pitrilysin family protein [Massilia sp. W12]|uniref:M16 family metallopeptidase n=1 Tax=Massilia sp. W12 TaxID=3126507 RepID=UPI0030D3F02C
MKIHTPRLLALPALLAALYGVTPALAHDHASHTKHAAPAAQSSAPQIAFEKFKLANGLEVILAPNKKLPVVTVNIWYHVGPANEEPGLTGFAHLFEHMMFAGTKHVPRGMADKLLESIGVTDSNGTTDFDRTNYFDTVPANQLETALWIHADRMGYLLDVLDQTALSNQQDVVRNERRQSVENRPYGIVEEGLIQLMLPKGHPYYAVVMGSHEDIQNAKLADIRNFFTRYYTPNNASLVLAGDFDPAQAKRLVQKYFGSFKRGPDVAKPKVETPKITEERRAVITDQVELPRVFMGWLTSPAYTPGDMELSLAAQILGGGKASRLYKKLVYEKQIAQDVAAAQYSNALTSMFMMDVTARPGKTAQEIEAAMEEELVRLRDEGPTEQELERARNTIETLVLTTVEKSSGLANQLNHYNQYTGDPGYLEKDLQRMRSVTPAAIKAAVAAQLQKNMRAVVHGVPGEKKLAPEVPVPPQAKEVKGEAKAMHAAESWRQKQPKAGPEPKLSLPQAQQFKLDNGLQVIYHKNPSLPLVAAELVIKSGAGSNPAQRPGLADFTSKMLEEGSQKRNALQIADELAQLGATVSSGSGQDASFVKMLSLRSNFARTLDVVADMVLNPAFPQAEIERQRAARMGELTQEKENPNQIAARVARMVQYGPQHPAAYPQIGSEQSMKDLQREDVLAFWRQHYLPNNAALVVSGDIDEAELKKLANQYFGAWKSGAAPQEKRISAMPGAAKVVLVDKPGASQTAVRVIADGPLRKDSQLDALEVLNAAMGGLFTSRINHNLREVKGYTYGVYSRLNPGRQYGNFSLGGGIRADATGDAISIMFKEVKDMLGKPMAAGEFKGARNAQVLTLPATFATNAVISQSMANLFIYDLPLDYYSKLPQRFAAVTPQSAQKAGIKYLQPELLKVIAVGDKAKVLPQLEKLKMGKIEERDAEGKLK